MNVAVGGVYLRFREQGGHQAHGHAESLALHWVLSARTRGLAQTHTGPLEQGAHKLHYLGRKEGRKERRKKE